MYISKSPRFFETNSITYFIGRSMSHDLNLTENLWGDLHPEKFLKIAHKPSKDIAFAIKQACSNISIDIQKWIFIVDFFSAYWSNWKKKFLENSTLLLSSNYCAFNQILTNLNSINKQKWKLYDLVWVFLSKILCLYKVGT